MHTRMCSWTNNITGWSACLGWYYYTIANNSGWYHWPFTCSVTRYKYRALSVVNNLLSSSLYCIMGSHTMEGADRAILREEPWWRNTEGNIAQFPGKYTYFPGNWTTASLLAGYTANYTARCQSFSLPRSSGDIRGSWRPKRSSLDAASSQHKASLCAGILSSCRLSHGKPVS